MPKHNEAPKTLGELWKRVQKKASDCREEVDSRIVDLEDRMDKRLGALEKLVSADVANLKSLETRYDTGHKELVGNVHAMLSTNQAEHSSIMGTLAELKTGQMDFKTATTVRLNGDGDVTIGVAVKQLYDLTAGHRAAVKAEEAWKAYLKQTRTGRFIASKTGKLIIVAVSSFFFLAALHVLGWEAVDPVGWLEHVFSKIFPGALPG
jgi:hypothetical protein